MEERFEYRLTFAKLDRAVYISHLDLMRTMQRAFKRARLPIWHTQGFNPHAYIMFPLALSLGVESRCEVMDVALTEDYPYTEVQEKLNAALPSGLEIVNAQKPRNPHTSITSAEYEMIFNAGKEDFLKFISREKIEIKKLTKKKAEKIIDIKPDIDVLCCEERGDGLFVRLRLPAGCDKNVNSSVVTSALCEFLNRNISCKTARTGIFMANGEQYS